MPSPNKSNNPLPKLIYVKSGRYYFVPRLDGKKKWIPLTQVDEGRPALDAAFVSLNAKAHPRTVAQLLARFAAEGKEERADSTWDAYVVVCTSPGSKLLSALGHFFLENLTPETCAQYLQLRKKEKRGASGNREMSTLSSAFEWARREGLCSVANPCRLKGRRNREKPSKYRIEHQTLSTLVDSVKPYIQNFLCVLYLTGFRMGDLFELKRENLNEKWIRIVERKNNVEHYKDYSKVLSGFLNLAIEHANLMADKYNNGDVSEYVFTNRYGRPLTYNGLRAAIKIAGNPFPLRQIRALAESDSPGTLGHYGQMRSVYTRTVRTKPVK